MGDSRKTRCDVVLLGTLRFVAGAFTGCIVGAFFAMIFGPGIDAASNASVVSQERAHERFSSRSINVGVVGFGLLAVLFGGKAVSEPFRSFFYGAATGCTLVVAAALAVAFFRNEQPFNDYHSESNSGRTIQIAREIGLPVGCLLGGSIGAGLQWRRMRRRKI